MQIEKRLQALGMSPNEARVYSVLLRYDRAGVSDLVKLSRIHRPNLYGVLTRLARRGFITSSVGRTKLFSASPPEAVFGLAINDTHKLLKAQEESVLVLQQTYSRRKAGNRPSPFMEIHRSASDEPSVGYWERIKQIGEAERELLILRVKHPKLLPPDKMERARMRVTETEIAALRRGVRCRSVLQSDALADPWERRYARRLIEAGEEARVTERLPGAFLVIDRRTVWFRPGSIDEKNVIFNVKDELLGEVFARAFESCWREGEDASTCLARAERTGLVTDKSRRAPQAARRRNKQASPQTATRRPGPDRNRAQRSLT